MFKSRNEWANIMNVSSPLRMGNSWKAFQHPSCGGNTTEDMISGIAYGAFVAGSEIIRQKSGLADKYPVLNALISKML